MKGKHLLRIAIITVLSCSSYLAGAQGMAVNSTGAAADPSAMLDVSATNQGLLVPRMTQTVIATMTNAATGLLVFQTDGTPGFYYNSSTTAGSPVWTAVSGSSSTGGGSIIPFASGTDFTMTTTNTGTSGSAALVGFGTNVSSVSEAPGPTIDLTGGPGTLMNEAFSMPRSGTITAISAYFSNTQALSLIGTTVFITAQLWSSPTPNNTFSPVIGTSVTLSPFLNGVIATGTICSGVISGLSISANPQTRYILVFSATAAGITLSNTIRGYGSAGVNIN